MALNEATRRKLGKEELIKLALEYLSKFDSTLSSMNDIIADLSELRRHYEKLESELLVTKQVNTKLCDQRKLLERHCWANEQYSRRECLEIPGVPESVSHKDLEGKVLNLFQKIDIEVHPDNIEACHWVKSNTGPKKVIIKMSRRKDADKFEGQRKN